MQLTIKLHWKIQHGFIVKQQVEFVKLNPVILITMYFYYIWQAFHTFLIISIQIPYTFTGQLFKHLHSQMAAFNVIGMCYQDHCISLLMRTSSMQTYLRIHCQFWVPSFH